jgi:hypothetical protein
MCGLCIFNVVRQTVARWIKEIVQTLPDLTVCNRFSQTMCLNSMNCGLLCQEGPKTLALDRYVPPHTPDCRFCDR